MKPRRIIARLDIKGPNVVKGLHFDGLRVVGDPAKLARKYYEQGADEILYIDIVASLYERNSLLDIVERATSAGIYVPMTVGGGVRNVEDIRKLLRAGADKVAINTAAVRNPNLIREASQIFGAQLIVGSIEAKRREDGTWESYIDNGRERTGKDAVAWAKELVELGAGELLVTSVDRDGTKRGYDLELIKAITGAVSVPVIAAGGAGSAEHVRDCLIDTGCDAAAIATSLHYGTEDILSVRTALQNAGIALREVNRAIESESVPSAGHVVSVVDYGAGNMFSVVNAFATIGVTVKVVTSAPDIETAKLLVLPGDGAFGYAMKQLADRGLIEPIKRYAASGRPLLGICLGMQLLLTQSEEFGNHQGLNLIPGKVRRFDEKPRDGDSHYRVPHIGWNALQAPPDVEWEGTILQDTPSGSEVYFVHSFVTEPIDASDVLASATYGGVQFCAVLHRANITATQFHPEKSGEVGISMMRRFAESS